jgi:hypothetical protein
MKANSFIVRARTVDARHQMAKSSDEIGRIAAGGVMTPAQARHWLTNLVLQAAVIESGQTAR